MLVTDGRTPVGQEVAAAFAAAGAALVHVGVADPWKPFAGEDRLRALDAVRLVPLDIADERSTADLAADLAGKTDILVNTASHIRAGGLLTRRGTATTHTEIAQSYLGFVHLAQAFGPAMRMRGGGRRRQRGPPGSTSCPSTPWRTGRVSAPTAHRRRPCLSLSHCLRAETSPGRHPRGQRLHRSARTPSISRPCRRPRSRRRAVAAAILAGLRAGIEDAFVGDVAEDIRRRLEANPKGLERELGQ